MTVWRVNTERDFAAIVNFDRNLYLKCHFRGPKDSLSGLSKIYYKTFRYWPMIWADNYSDAISNPNDIPPNYPLLIRRPDRITEDDRFISDVLFDAWSDYPSAREARIANLRSRMKAKREAQAAIQNGDQPEWVRWNNARP